MKSLINRVKRIYSLRKFYFHFGFRFVISLLRYRNEKAVILFDRKAKYTNQFWFLHSLQEIFIDQVYLFSSKNNCPFIIDCGANIGLSIIYFKRLFPDSKIIGFEPDPRNFEILEENIKSFSFENIELLNSAVWKQKELLVFESAGSVGSKLIGNNKKVKNAIEVQAVPLLDFIRDRDVDFLKIDIEGAEYEVLRSCNEHLGRVKNLFVEYHSLPGEKQALSDLLGILTDAGFRYYIKEAWENLKHPYVSQVTPMFDLQLNIFAYR